MTADLSWLPERHLPVAATLAHADDLFGRLTEVLFTYSTQDGGPIHLAEDQAGRYSRTTVTGVAPLPRSIALYAADVLTTLRAALEHTLYAEVEHANRRALTPAEARLVEMPAARTSEVFDGWVRRGKRPTPLQHGAPVLERVRRLQPYQRGIRPEEHLLFLLAAHSNLAKHRVPLVAALRLAAIRPDAGPIDPRVRIPNPVEGPVRVGDVLAEIPLGVRVPVALFPTVGLNRPGTDQWPVLVTELADIASWVRTQAIPLLITGTTDVDPLPASHDITTGHSDERSAIHAGTQHSAAERYRTRLGAAVTRLDLAELFNSHPDKPDPRAVQRWLDSLDDDAILHRMRRIIPGHTLAHAQHNIDVLAGMVAEIRTFEDPGNHHP